MKSILMICRGNICRSPMAESFFAHQLRQQNSSIGMMSAGINALVGHPADSFAKKVMESHGINISSHRGQQVNDSLIRKADLILVMTHNQLSTITQHYMVAKGKTFLLSHWQGLEIKDPYQKEYEVFEKVYDQIKLAWEEWKTRILACHICI